ncbi:MAG: L-serine ammonia-lyase, iron-sulfur-dependent, subunit alpha [Bacteroidales bacterium]
MMPSIFNDVLGPVMRGPSSSHTAGSYRIGLLLRDLAGQDIQSVDFDFHPGGSLATTYHTQGSDIGLATGLLGMDILDPEMTNSLDLAKKSDMGITFNITDYPADHPNTYKCSLVCGNGEKVTATVISTGGGMIRMIDIMGFPVDLPGDDAVLFAIFHDSPDCMARKDIEQQMTHFPGYSGSSFISGGKGNAVVYRFSATPDLGDCQPLFQSCFRFFRLLKPVMPIPGQQTGALPFHDLAGLLKSPDLMAIKTSQLARIFESARSGYSVEKLDGMMANLVNIWRSGIKTGLGGTEYADRLIGSQSPGFMAHYHSGSLIEAGPLNLMIAYSTALMEVKSSMGVVIAAPTAGACGGLPGCLIGYADFSGKNETLKDGFWAAGLVGLFIAMDATFAAEVAGCQAETGAGSAMAAAGLVEMAGGSAQQAFDAASLAMQNVMGLVCDPIANRVEIPCLGRNANGAGNALTSANMVLGGIQAVIPLNETIITMFKVGQAMHSSLRCTALGGLSDTPTARRMEAAINGINLKK